MAPYGYGPPPPAPPPAVAPAGSPTGYPQYPQGYQQPQRGGHAARGGRGGHHGPAPTYPYSSQPPHAYVQQPGQPYPGPGAPQGGYPAPQWHHDQAHVHAQQPQPQGSLPPQNYHPNYAPQLYQQHPPPYGQQPAPYNPQQPPQPYGQYPPQAQPPAPHPQQWSGHGQSPQTGPHFSGGRGRGGHHNDRGGSAAPVMGPPIRMGFENQHQGPPAPVSNGGFPHQYGPPQSGSPFPPAPYQGYPPPSGPPQMVGAPPFDPYQSHSNRQHARGGHHGNNFRGRSNNHIGGDKMRHKKPHGHGAAPHPHHQKPDAPTTGRKKKRKVNNIFNLQSGEAGEESNEDEAEEPDEEAKLAEMIGPDAINPTDLAAWIAERRQNFPTESRKKLRKAESAQSGENTKNEGRKEGALTSLEKQHQRLRKKLEKVESSIKRKREQQDEGDEMRDVDGSTTLSSASKSDDEAPESLPSKPQTVVIPPPTRKADPTKHCKYYSTGGTCGKKGKCRFVHDPEVREAALKEREMNGGRMTLQQRLTLNDKEQEDLTIVKTLQYLKEKGLMTASQPAANGSSPPTTAAAPAAAEPPSHLPPPPTKAEMHHSLPSHPPPSADSNANTPYQGWNLSGFGNTGVKTGDDL